MENKNKPTIHHYTNIKPQLTQYQKAAQICMHNLKLFQNEKVALIIDVDNNKADLTLQNFNKFLYFAMKNKIKIDIYGGLIQLDMFDKNSYSHYICVSNCPYFTTFIQTMVEAKAQIHCTTLLTNFKLEEYVVVQTTCSSNFKLNVKFNPNAVISCFNRINNKVCLPQNYNMFAQREIFMVSFLNNLKDLFEQAELKFKPY